MREKSKKIYYLLIICLLFSLSCKFFLRPQTPDNDMQFLAGTGRYILNNGFPRINPFTWHEGLKIVVQQWMAAVIDYFVKSRFGNLGFYVLGMVYLAVHILFLVRFIYSYVKSRSAVIVVLVVNLLSVSGIMNTRANIVSSSILSLILYECFLLRNHINSPDCTKKEYRDAVLRFLFSVSASSLFIANFQIAQLPILLLYIYPFLMPDDISCIREGMISYYSRKKKRYVPYLSGMAAAILVGFINPYGAEGVLYLLHSSCIKNGFVIEHLKPDISSFAVWAAMFYLAFFAVWIYVCREKTDITVFFLTLGSFFLSMTMRRNGWYIVYACLPTAALVKKVFSEQKIRNAAALFLPYTKIQQMVLGAVLCIVSSGVFVAALFGDYSIFDGSYDNSYTPIEAVDYLKGQERPYRVLNQFNDGGYLIYNDIPVYIDPRPEIYAKDINKKEDVFDEYVKFRSSEAECMEVIDAHPDLTHVLVCSNEFAYYYMQKRDDFRIVIKPNESENKKEYRDYALFERKE